MRIKIRILLLVVFTMVCIVMVGCEGSADCGSREDVSQEDLLDCVTIEGVREHLLAFQEIAEDNDGTRCAGTPGYDASLSYVANTLKEAGYDVELDGFDFTFEARKILQQTVPVDEIYEAGTILGSGSGAVSGPVFPVDLSLGQESQTTDPSSGCELSDFESLDLSSDNDIALFNEGGCLFSKKALNAQTAGAEAAIFLLEETLLLKSGMPVGKANLLIDASPSNVTIPLVGTDLAYGQALSQEGAEAAIQVPAARETTQYNLLAELPGELGEGVVMVGAHLDSVLPSPGISDNGSGSAAVLETAVHMAGIKPRNTVRFAWWGAEEYGLVGSKAYIESLSPEEIEKIAMYLNFDMIGSPNHFYGIYDADNSDNLGGGSFPEGSAVIEKLFEQFFTELDVPYQGIDLEGRSDHVPFKESGIPVGGLFTGAEHTKKKKQAEIFGGAANEPYDACYHKPCDSTVNINEGVLAVNADAVAFAVYHFAMNEAESNN